MATITAQSQSDDDVWVSESDPETPILASQDLATEAYLRQSPDSLTPSGYCRFSCDSASGITQQVSPIIEANAGRMSTTFVIVQRPKKTEMNRANRMIQILPGPNGEGIRQEAYQKNPIVLFNHGYDGFALPIGISEDAGGKYTVKATKSQLTGTVFFSQSSALAASIFALIEERIIRMSSIGFNAEKVVEIELAKAESPPGVQTTVRSYGVDVVQSEMVEWSVVPIGADREALRQCLETGKIRGKHYFPGLTQFFRQWAAEKQAWSPGFRENEQSSSSGDNGLSAIASTLAEIKQSLALLTAEKLAKTTVQQQSSQSEFHLPQVDVSRQLIDNLMRNLPSKIAQGTVPTMATDNTTTEFQSMVSHQLPGMVSQAVALALKPTQQTIEALENKLTTMTGALPK